LLCIGGDTNRGCTEFCEETDEVLLAWLAAEQLDKTGAGTWLALETAIVVEFPITYKRNKVQNS
jgi:hypothetical protein